MKKEGRIDSREMGNCEVSMNFPDGIRIMVEELADDFTKVSGEFVNFPDIVCICIEWVHSIVFGHLPFLNLEDRPNNREEN